MEDSKDYFVANIVANEAMQCNGYMNFIRRNMKERISNGILDIVSDGNEYAIKMLPEQRIKKPDMLSVEIRQGISVQELVRCKDCKNWLECLIRTDDDGERYSRCCLNGIAVGESFYCADGERRSDGNKT